MSPVLTASVLHADLFLDTISSLRNLQLLNRCSPWFASRWWKLHYNHLHCCHSQLSASPPISTITCKTKILTFLFAILGILRSSSATYPADKESTAAHTPISSQPQYTVSYFPGTIVITYLFYLPPGLHYQIFPTQQSLPLIIFCFQINFLRKL